MAERPDRVAIVTGAASGIGAATALGLAGPGTALVLHSRAAARKLEAVAVRCRGAGSEVTTILRDFDLPERAGDLAGLALERFGQLDQIVATAGFADRTPLAALELGQLRRSARAMPEAFLVLAQASMAPLRRSAWGRVVAVSSFVAHRFAGDALFPASAAAKAALEAAARSLAAVLAPAGCTVNLIVPGYVQKDPDAQAAIDEAAWRRAVAATPTGRLATPTEVAAAILFLLSREAGQITGQALHVDGGLSLG